MASVCQLNQCWSAPLLLRIYCHPLVCTPTHCYKTKLGSAQSLPRRLNRDLVSPFLVPGVMHDDSFNWPVAEIDQRRGTDAHRVFKLLVAIDEVQRLAGTMSLVIHPRLRPYTSTSLRS